MQITKLLSRRSDIDCVMNSVLKLIMSKNIASTIMSNVLLNMA